MHDSLGERVKFAREQSRLTQETLGQRVGVSKASVNQWETGKTKNLRLDNLFALERVTGFAAMWIAVKQGPMRRGDAAADRSSGELERASLYLVDPEAIADMLDSLQEHEQQSGVTLSNEKKGEKIAKFCTRLVIKQQRRDRARVASIISQVLHEDAP